MPICKRKALYGIRIPDLRQYKNYVEKFEKLANIDNKKYFMYY